MLVKMNCGFMECVKPPTYANLLTWSTSSARHLWLLHQFLWMKAELSDPTAIIFPTQKYHLGWKASSYGQPLPARKECPAGQQRAWLLKRELPCTALGARSSHAAYNEPPLRTQCLLTYQ